MPKEFVLFDKKFEISQSYIRLFLTIFMIAVLAKGSVIFSGFAVDDYSFSSGISLSGTIDLFIYQGRYIGAAIVWIIDSLGVNINDMYFSLGIVTLLLYSAFVASILRFVGMDSSPAAGLVGGIMIAHPYLTEIFTFRMSLPFLAVALIFSIIALEMVVRRSVTWDTRGWALLATLAMLFITQNFLNYFAVAIIFAYIHGQVLHNKKGQLSATNIYQERAITLAIISTIASIVALVIMKLAKTLGLTFSGGRTSFIAVDKIPERIEQMLSVLASIYWTAQPVFSGGLKILVALMLFVSVAIIFWYLLIKNRKENTITHVLFTFFAFLLLIPVSLGIIIFLEDWWPVPRVISHVAIIVGLTFLLADLCIQNLSNCFLKSIISISRMVILIGFIFLSNQILVDQQRVNQWDRAMANRIIARLETQPEFNNIQFIYVNGGSWDYPIGLKMLQGDMNISAFGATAKFFLWPDVSGYKFKAATTKSQSAIGKSYCATRQPWPSPESISINNDMAIICLKIRT